VVGTLLVTAVRTNGHDMVCCLKKLLAGTNKHYCMNTDNNSAETTQRLKCCLGCHTASSCDNSKCLLVSCAGKSKFSIRKTD
jgi:hypothetical protein